MLHQSALSKTYNHILYKRRLTKNMFYRENAYITCRQSIVNCFSVNDEVLYRDAFVQSIVYGRENPQLLSKAEILNFNCTE